MSAYKTTPLLLCAILLYPAAAYAVDGISVGYAQSSTQKIEKIDLALSWKGPTLWRFASDRYPLSLIWEAHIGQWVPHEGQHTQSLVEIGASPVLRQELPGAWHPYLEASIGPVLLSHTASSDQHRFATAYQFYDFVGVGIQLGAHGAMQASYRLIHESNCDIKQPNPGTNFNQLTLQYNF